MVFVCPESLDCELCFLSLQAAMLAMLAIGVFTFGSPNHALAARSGGRASGHFRSSSSRVHSSGSRTTRIGGSVGGGSGTLDITSQSDVMCFMIMGGTVAILELKKKYANKKLGLTTGEHVEIKGIRKWISTPSTPPLPGRSDGGEAAGGRRVRRPLPFLPPRHGLPARRSRRHLLQGATEQAMLIRD